MKRCSNQPNMQANVPLHTGWIRPAALGLALLAGAAVSTPATAVAEGPAAAAATPALRRAPCDDTADTQCAGLEVPVDPADPGGPKLTLRFARVSAADSVRSKGVLLYIPGGPGAGIAELFGAYRADFRVDELRRDRDVLTFGPRGVGESGPVRCAPGAVPSASLSDGGVASPAEIDALARANAAFAQSCFDATGELMHHLSAAVSAADIERIRQAPGPEGGLVAYAGSYGSRYAGAYLERYGDHVKALVLDGVFDHSVDLPTMAARNALGVEDAFARFARWCDEDPACALHGRDVRAVFDAVTAARPDARPVVGQALAAGRDPRLGWPALAQVLARVAGGDPAALDRFVAVIAAYLSGGPGVPGGPAAPLAIYAPDRVVETDGPTAGSRSDILRADVGRMGWLRHRGRLWERL
jgi:pimeloyl-ACP methyl ester carboxylesterase